MYVLRRLILLCFLAVFCASFITPPQVNAQTTVKAMTFNIGTYFDMPAAEREQRMNNLADVIVEHRAELVFLQEFNNLPGIQDKTNLIAGLDERGWPVYHDAVPYENPDKPGSILLILSRYPLDASTKQVIYRLGDRTNRSAQSIIVRNTPIGWFRLSNLHTHNTEPCNNFRDLLNFFYQFDKSNSLIGGDTNILLYDKPITNCRGGGAGDINWNDVNITCRDTSQCKQEGIDWFFTAGESDLFIQAQLNVGNLRNISDQHPAVVAYIGSDNPKLENCTLQGYKVFTDTPETTVRVVIDNNSSFPTTGNPYSHPVGPGGHRISVTPPANTTPGYTLCYNRTDCHTQAPTPGVSVDVQCEGGKFIDLWWHFTGIAEPTPPPPTPPPTPPTCENDPDINGNGTVDIFDYNLLVTNFGRAVTANNRAVDINCNNAIEIFDYNILVTAFGN